MKYNDSHVDALTTAGNVRMAVNDSHKGEHTHFCFATAPNSTIVDIEFNEEAVRDLRDLLNQRLGEDYSTEVETLLEASKRDGARIEELVGKLGRQKEALEQKFVEQVMGYEQGCDDGKREFLRSIGLKPPSCGYQVTFTFQACGDDGDVITEIQRNIEGGYNVSDGIEEFEVLDVEARLY